jgi:hypothetical protein
MRFMRPVVVELPPAHLPLNKRAKVMMRHYSVARVLARQEQEDDPLAYRAKTLVSGMRERARRLGLPIDKERLTVNYIADRLDRSPNCECCNVPLEIFHRCKMGENRAHDRSPTIDRIIPRKGYIFENVAILCFRCNTLKRDAAAEELERVAAWMRQRGCLAAEFLIPGPSESIDSDQIAGPAE